MREFRIVAGIYNSRHLIFLDIFIYCIYTRAYKRKWICTDISSCILHIMSLVWSMLTPNSIRFALLICTKNIPWSTMNPTNNTNINGFVWLFCNLRTIEVMNDLKLIYCDLLCRKAPFDAGVSSILVRLGINKPEKVPDYLTTENY